MEPEFLATPRGRRASRRRSDQPRAPPSRRRRRTTARQVIRKVVDELMAKLEQKTAEAIRGALNRAQAHHAARATPTSTGRAPSARNLGTYQPDYEHHRAGAAGRLSPVAAARRSRRGHPLRRPVRLDGDVRRLFVDLRRRDGVDPGHRRPSSSCFDTSIVDLTEKLADPVEVLFGVQLGGGTDINRALAYCQDLVAPAGEDAPRADHRPLRRRQSRRDAGSAPRSLSRAAST